MVLTALVADHALWLDESARLRGLPACSFVLWHVEQQDVCLFFSLPLWP